MRVIPVISGGNLTNADSLFRAGFATFWADTSLTQDGVAVVHPVNWPGQELPIMEELRAWAMSQGQNVTTLQALLRFSRDRNLAVVLNVCSRGLVDKLGMELLSHRDHVTLVGHDWAVTRSFGLPTGRYLNRSPTSADFQEMARVGDCLLLVDYRAVQNPLVRPPETNGMIMIAYPMVNHWESAMIAARMNPDAVLSSRPLEIMRLPGFEPA